MSEFILDLHCHTKDHSFDGQIPAAELVGEMVEARFSGVAFTDHEYQWPREELEELRYEARLPAEFLLLSGQEVRTTSTGGGTVGDLLVFGLEDSLRDGTPAAEVFSLLRARGGFATAPHPAVPVIGLGDALRDFPVLAVETWNGRYGKRFEPGAIDLARHYALPMIGGSDAHKHEDIASGGTVFPRLPADLREIQLMIGEGIAKPWKPGLLNRVKRLLGPS